jgi:hypothetical protein
MLLLNTLVSNYNAFLIFDVAEFFPDLDMGLQNRLVLMEALHSLQSLTRLSFKGFLIAAMVYEQSRECLRISMSGICSHETYYIIF